MAVPLIKPSMLTDCPFNVQVSWVRHRDVHILTAGEQTFTTDQRFSAKHNTDDEWVLVIKYVQVRSSGHPPRHLILILLFQLRKTI